jgi:hypothetical protein
MSANKTQIIITFDEKPNYYDDFTAKTPFFQFFDTKLDTSSELIINDGLVEKIYFTKDVSSLNLNFSIQGKYDHYDLLAKSNPQRLFITVRGEPGRKKRNPKTNIAKQTQKLSPQKSSSESLTHIDQEKVFSKPKAKIISNTEQNMTDLKTKIFSSQEPVVLDLYHVPVKEILKYFSNLAIYPMDIPEVLNFNINFRAVNLEPDIAFQQLLTQIEYEYKFSNNRIKITSKGITQNSEEAFSIYLKDISAEDMKIVLDYFLPGKNLILTHDSNNRIDLITSPANIALADSLVKKFDVKPYSINLTAVCILLSKFELEKFEFSKDGYAYVDVNILNSLKNDNYDYKLIKNFESQINATTEFDFIQEKTFSYGFLYMSKINLESGCKIDLKTYLSRDKWLTFDIKSNWHQINKHLSHLQSSQDFSIDVDVNQGIIIKENKIINSDKIIDNWLASFHDKINLEKEIPVILIIPEANSFN